MNIVQNESSKVYLDIVKQLNNMIEEDSLVAGDKIPSERELSELFQVGRSSVREALRSMELLGLIETRRGEGTFIRDFQDHKLVEILGSFFLREKKTQLKLLETKNLLEMDCIRLAIREAKEAKIESMLHWVKNSSFDDFSFFKQLASTHENTLLQRIWSIVGIYENSVTSSREIVEKEPYVELLIHLRDRDEKQALYIYSNSIRK